MKYQDFLEIARYGNENWKGYYTEEEIIQNAKNYQINYDYSKANGKVDNYTTKFLLNNLAEDWANGNNEVAKWLREMITELKLTEDELRNYENANNLIDFIRS